MIELDPIPIHLEIAPLTEKDQAFCEGFAQQIYQDWTYSVELESTGVWKHTFTAPDYDVQISALPASPKDWSKADPFFYDPRANCRLAHKIAQSVKRYKAQERAKKRTRRKLRATFRRRKRGLA